MNTTTRGVYTARIEFDERDGILVGRILGLHGVIGCHDEALKAVIVLRAEVQGRAQPEDITARAREHMAACKVPKVVQFVDALPMFGSGLAMWRPLQDDVAKRAAH
jgi:acyl-CoA synthetase (AMP-forming)/AMP-acid ligase II